MTNKNIEHKYDLEDIEKNKTMAGLAYFLFFLPLITAPDSEFGKFHANQGLLLLIFIVVGNFIIGITGLLGWVLMIPFSILSLALGIMGLINGFGGKAKELPLIGHFRIIK